ncbi:Vitamin B12 import system permease protein BtuC [Streptomyces microflavus]
MVAALALGSVRIPPGQVLDILTGRAEASPFRTIVLDVRLPRVLLGIVDGAGLAVNGTVLQALVRNQLADPFLTRRLVRRALVDGANGDQLRRFVNVYLNDEDVRFLDGITTKLTDGDNVTILPAVAGGMR